MIRKGLPYQLYSVRSESNYIPSHREDEEGTYSASVRNAIMGGVNLQRIAVPMFDGTILNWQSFWEPFQAAVHDKPHIEDVDKLTCLRVALNCGPAKYSRVDTDDRKLWRSN